MMRERKELRGGPDISSDIIPFRYCLSSRILVPFWEFGRRTHQFANGAELGQRGDVSTVGSGYRSLANSSSGIPNWRTILKKSGGPISRPPWMGMVTARPSG